MSTHLDESQSATEAVLHQLKSAVAGAVHAPGTGGYDLAVAGYNVATVHRPAAVVVAAGAADVAAAVDVARTNGFTVAVKATGHGAAAAGPDSIMLVTSELTSLTIDPDARTATVGAGVRWQRVLDAATPYGLGGLAGSAPTAGVVGYTLGGGMGPIARTHGFAADHVVALEVVTADGQIRTVTADSDPDLFWAIRGGGAAFGIVTQITFRLFPIQTLSAGGLYFDIRDAARVLHGWREWVHMLPESVSTSVAIVNLPPLPELPEPIRGKTVLHVRYAHADENEDDIAIVGAIRSLATPLLDAISEILYSDLASIHSDPVDPMPVAERSVLLAELPAEAIEKFLATVGPAGELPLIISEIRLMGGALARPAAVPNAVAGRTAAFNLLTVGVAAPPVADVVVAALEHVVDTMEPWGTGGALLNFAGGNVGAPARRVAAAWGPQTYLRLRAIRNAYDPTGVLAAAARW